jgi:hypothetical protein
LTAVCAAIEKFPVTKRTLKVILGALTQQTLLIGNSFSTQDLTCSDDFLWQPEAPSSWREVFQEALPNAECQLVAFREKSEFPMMSEHSRFGIHENFATALNHGGSLIGLLQPSYQRGRL